MLVYWSQPVVVLPQACSDAHELSCGSDKGGRTTATLFSLIATCHHPGELKPPRPVSVPGHQFRPVALTGRSCLAGWN